MWWGDVNQPTTPEVFDNLLNKAVNHFNSLDKVYLFDGYCGSNEKSRRRVRFVHELSWQQHFVSNMFIRPDSDEKLYENENIEIKPSLIQPLKEIKSLGTFKVKIDLHSEVQAEIKIKVDPLEQGN